MYLILEHVDMFKLTKKNPRNIHISFVTQWKYKNIKIKNYYIFNEGNISSPSPAANNEDLNKKKNI